MYVCVDMWRGVCACMCGLVEESVCVYVWNSGGECMCVWVRGGECICVWVRGVNIYRKKYFLCRVR